jgi:energy-coupling factor transporter ATP-binding protein EcfA2
LFIEAKNLELRFEGKTVFSNVNFEVNEGEVWLLTGRNGSGKTSLLKILAGIIPWITKGEVRGKISIGGVNPLVNPDELAYKLRMLHPDPQQFLLAPTPYDDIGFSLSILGIENIKERVFDIARKLRLPDILYNPIIELSTGQQQKTAIASTIAPGVKCLLLDEPLSHLDPFEKNNLLGTLDELKKEGYCAIIATHYPEMFSTLSDGVIQLSEQNKSFNSCSIAPPEPGNTVMLEANNVQYEYPSGKKVLTNVNLSLKEREILVIYGRNGSGKTTLLRILAGILKPKNGTITSAKKPALLPPDPIKVFTMPTLRKELNNKEPPQFLTELFDLPELMDKPLSHLSTGELKKAALSVLFTHGSSIILLDEPESGLDPESRCTLARYLSALASKGASLVVATHDHDFGELIASRKSYLEDGELRFVN